MSRMSDFEARANNIATAICASRDRIEDFGYGDDPVDEAVSRIYGMFITWLTSCEEARHEKGYSESVIAALPDQDDPNWRVYMKPLPKGTLKQRAQCLWGIRVAFTHGDGEIASIQNIKNRTYAENAATILPGVSLENNRLLLNRAIEHTAIRTMVQIRDIL